MATQSIRSLETLSKEYAVFERDQVLTEEQLNSVGSYFDDQERLTRVELLGIGVIGGLRVANVTGKVKVSKGLGLTSDGDLLLLPADTTYDSIKPYDESAPAYPPFYTGSGANKVMLKLWELVKEGESDVSKQPLAALPSPLSNYVVVMYMESCEQDHDLCSSTDCDNLGIVATHIPRMLLVHSSDAPKLQANIATLTQKASLLSELVASRPAISGALTTTAALGTLYLNACNNIHSAVSAALGGLHQQIPVLTQDLFGGDPSVAWTNTLNTARAGFVANTSGIQYYYDFLRDVVETWNALREALLDNDGVMCPDLASFPKHLLLGALANPAQARTGFYPSPLIGEGRSHLEHAHFLAWKLHVLINTFALPASAPAPAIVVTPGRSELQSLEERAIPYYYRTTTSFGVLAAWNWRRTKRGTHTGITGYRAAALGASTAAQSPLTGQIGCYDFFRIEGHLGQDIDEVMNKLESEIATRNLPFTVRSVLLHSVTAPMKRRPKIRYTDLHRMHKVVRAQVDSELLRTASYSTHYKTRIKTAASNGNIPNDTAKMSKADQHDATIVSAVGESRKAFSANKYSAFKADKQWSVQHETAVKTAGVFKQDFGDVSRMDYISAFDNVMISTHKNWLDWIDVLIEDKDKKADERLLFKTYLKSHPGMEHCGGVLRGGTFVVVYNDSAKVVADFMLPYRDIEEEEDEPEEPPLTYIPPPFINDGYVIVKPIDWHFNDLRIDIAKDWQREIKIQTDYTEFFRESLGSLGDVLGQVGGKATVPGLATRPEVDDIYLNGLLEHIESLTQQIEMGREQFAKGGVPLDLVEKMNEQLDRYQQDLGNAVDQATRYMVETEVDVSIGQDAAVAVQVLGKGVKTVTDKGTLQQIEANFKDLNETVGAGQKPLITGVMNVGGMKFN